MRGSDSKSSTQSDAAAFQQRRSERKRPGKFATTSAKNAGTKKNARSRSNRKRPTHNGASGKDTGAKGKGKGTGKNQNIKNEGRQYQCYTFITRYPCARYQCYTFSTRYQCNKIHHRMRKLRRWTTEKVQVKRSRSENDECEDGGTLKATAISPKGEKHKMS